MQAIVLVRHHADPNKAFEMQEKTIPTPKSTEICVEVECFGLNYADVLAFKGMYPDAPKLPAIMGYDVVGRIRAVGSAVTHLQEGQRVVALTRFGGYAQFALTDGRAAVLIPDSADAAEAVALATQYTTAYYAAEEMVRMHKGDRVLIQAAAGGVGTALIQLAKRAGCYIYGTVGSEDKVAYIKNLGVDMAINYQTQDFEQIIRNDAPNGVDIVFESIGGTVFKKSKRLLSAGGRIVTFGVASMNGKGIQTLNVLKTAMGFGFGSDISYLQTSRGIIGVNMLRIADKKPEVLQRCMQEVVNLWQAGELKPTVGGRFKATELSKALDALGNRKTVGKIAVFWS